MAVLVNVDNFVLAETHRMFADIQAVAGVSGVFGTTGHPPASMNRRSSDSTGTRCTASRSLISRNRPN